MICNQKSAESNKISLFTRYVWKINLKEGMLYSRQRKPCDICVTTKKHILR